MHCLDAICQYLPCQIPYSGNVWRIAELKEIGKIKFGKLIDFSHRDAIYKLNFGWLKFGESQTTHQIRQTFPLLNIPAIWYLNKANSLIFPLSINCAIRF